MKRLTQLTATLVFALLLALPVTVFAAHSWRVSMSDPTVANQPRSFSIGYVALSTEEADKITVNLLENGSVIATQTTPPRGDSGTFDVEVPADGSYTYSLSASSSVDGSSKSTNAKQVTVSTPEGADQSDITVRDVNQAEQAANGGADGSDGTPDGQDGEVQADVEGEGIVDDEAAQTENDEDGDGDDSSTSDAILWGLVALLALGLGYAGYAQYRGRKAEEDL